MSAPSGSAEPVSQAEHPEPPGESLTIDELAARTGISVRTIRFYSGRGLLPPPRLRGRTGLYGPAHVARLELAAELSGLGFTLAGIEAHLSRLPVAAGAAELALHRALLTPWVPEEVEEVDRAELDRRAGRALTVDQFHALAGLGVIDVLVEDRVRLHGATTLAGGLAALESGVPVELLRKANAIIERHTGAMADELMALFQDEVLQPFRDAGRPATERHRLAAALAQFKPVTVRGVVTAFGRAVNRTIRERLG